MHTGDGGYMDENGYLYIVDRIKDMIIDPMRTSEITDAVKEGAHPYGMLSFDQSLTNLVKRNLISYETALSASTNPDDFALFFRGVE